jgi:hypothetical protein
VKANGIKTPREVVEQMREMRRAGTEVRNIAQVFGLSHSCVLRYTRDIELTHAQPLGNNERNQLLARWAQQGDHHETDTNP